ncbi:MAG TPA: FlgO family outer membrane protein [Duganella sp.]
MPTFPPTLSMTTSLARATLVALPLLLAACSTPSSKEEGNYSTISSNQFIDANYKAADSLRHQLTGKLSADKPLIMATIVNIDALEQTTTLGRLVSEQLSTRLAQGGLSMVEMKLRNNVYLKRNQGELMLTREIGEVATAHNAQAIVVGSYAETSDMVFINVKVIQPNTNFVLAGQDYVLAKESIVRSMLQRN